jgi:DNA-binding transcriptional LysR family regulator
MFKHHDTLRLFAEIAQHGSFSAAADALHMTKGAISYQIKTLEADLGLTLFDRNARGVTLTTVGEKLWIACHPHFQEIETMLLALKAPQPLRLTVGTSSYFASRWLSPRLMTFMQQYPDIQLRLQPMTQLVDLEHHGVDIAVRWGKGQWNDVKVTPFMSMPAWPVGNQEAAEKVQQVGLARAFTEFTLLRDHDESNAWSDWLKLAGLPAQNRRDTLIIPDPNVRVQAVINGQGIALNDALVAHELSEHQLVRLAEVELGNYGYFLVKPRNSNRSESVDAFVGWLLEQ